MGKCAVGEMGERGGGSVLLEAWGGSDGAIYIQDHMLSN